MQLNQTCSGDRLAKRAKQWYEVMQQVLQFLGEPLSEDKLKVYGNHDQLYFLFNGLKVGATSNALYKTLKQYLDDADSWTFSERKAVESFAIVSYYRSS